MKPVNIYFFCLKYKGIKTVVNDRSLGMPLCSCLHLPYSVMVVIDASYSIDEFVTSASYARTRQITVLYAFSLLFVMQLCIFCVGHNMSEYFYRQKYCHVVMLRMSLLLNTLVSFPAFVEFDLFDGRASFFRFDRGQRMHSDYN